MTRVAAVGVAVMDKIFTVEAIPPEPTKVFATSYREIGGGPAATGAVTVARLGGAVRLFARVGDDPVGRRIAEEIADWGVEPCIRRVPGGQSGVSAVVIDKAGERLIVAFADPDLDPDPSWLPDDMLEGAGALLADLRWPRGSEHALHEARRSGIPSVLDADLAAEGIAEHLAPLADHVVFSRPALARFTGLEDPRAALLRAADRLPGVVGVTLGAEGYAWKEPAGIRYEPAPPIDPVDTLGAGDVFHGAFALGIAEGLSVEDAARLANAAAAIKCTRPGGRAGIPNRVEVESLLGMHHPR